MTMSFVRLGPPELAEISNRLQIKLTPEGYEAWYRNDVPRLLLEIGELRHERNLALAELGAEEDTSLVLAARNWQANVSGFWEKTQTRKLRDQIANAKLGRDEALAMVHELETQKAELREALAYSEVKLLDEMTARENQVQEIMAQKQELADVAGKESDARANAELEAQKLRNELESLAARDRAGFEEWQARAREALKALQDVIG